MLKYKPGDKVIVLPYEEIRAKLPITVWFSGEMVKFCGEEYEIAHAQEFHGIGCYQFTGHGYWFTDEMLEDTQDVPFDGEPMGFDSIFAQ